MALSLVIILVTLLHIYVRYCVLRRHTSRQSDIQLQRVHTTTTNALVPTVIATLPAFIFKQNEDEEPTTECAVCIWVLKDGESVKILPNCNHKFHAECIDTWLAFKSTCPNCRTEAEPHDLLPKGTLAKLMNGLSTSSRLNSFRRILSRERSSQRIQSPTQENDLQYLERDSLGLIWVLHIFLLCFLFASFVNSFPLFVLTVGWTWSSKGAVTLILIS